MENRPVVTILRLPHLSKPRQRVGVDTMDLHDRGHCVHLHRVMPYLARSVHFGQCVQRIFVNGGKSRMIADRIDGVQERIRPKMRRSCILRPNHLVRHGSALPTIVALTAGPQQRDCPGGLCSALHNLASGQPPRGLPTSNAQPLLCG
jgi:hypothetical protein